MVEIGIYKKIDNVRVCKCLCQKHFLPFKVLDEVGVIEKDIIVYNICDIVPAAPLYEPNLTDNKDELYMIMKENQIYIEDNFKKMQINKNSLYKDNLEFSFEVRENF